MDIPATKVKIMTQGSQKAHFTDAQLDEMYEASKRDFQFVGSEIRQLIGDIRTARAALTASPGEQKPVAWIDFADNRNVRLWTSEQRRADAEMALGRKMTPVYTSPPPAAGWDEAIEAAINIVKPWPGAEGFARSEADKAVENIRRELVKALEALRRESPGPEGAVKDDLDAKIAALAHRFWSIHPSAIAAKNLTREQFYAQEMTKLIKAVRG